MPECKKTLAQLKQMKKYKTIKGRSSMNREQLCKAMGYSVSKKKSPKGTKPKKSAAKKPAAKAAKKPAAKAAKKPAAKAAKKPAAKAAKKPAVKAAKKPKSPRGCTKQEASKYAARGSPPYPANECQGEMMTGNDGELYVSKPNKNGVYRWVKFSAKL